MLGLLQRTSSRPIGLSKSKAAALTPEGWVIMSRIREGWVMYEGAGLELIPRHILRSIITDVGQNKDSKTKGTGGKPDAAIRH